MARNAFRHPTMRGSESAALVVIARILSFSTRAVPTLPTTMAVATLASSTASIQDAQPASPLPASLRRYLRFRSSV